MQSKQFEVEGFEDLEEVAEYLIDKSREIPLIILKGDLGAGKTTLTKIMCKLLNVKDEVTSPTFSLINHYLTEQGKNIYHFDLYRVEDLEEVLDIGFDEYIESNDLCIIEWPDVAMDLLPDDKIEVFIQLKGSKRLFNISI